jgi:cysteine desulfurase
VPGIVGFGAAARILAGRREADVARIMNLRQRLLSKLERLEGRFHLVGQGVNGLPGTAFFSSARVAGDTLALKLDAAGFSVSSGSACDAGNRQSPRTLVAAVGADRARNGGIRISFGRFTSEDEIESLAEALGRLV